MSASKGLTTAAIAIGIIAIILGGSALAVSFIPGLSPASGYQPRTRAFTIRMGEGGVIWEAVKNDTTGITTLISEDKGGEDMQTGEFHKWEPGSIVVFKGDSVTLTIINPRRHAHSFVLTAFAIDTGRILGRDDPGSPTEAQRTKVVTFTADQAGVFKWICGTPHDHTLNNCDPDHEFMVGYITVLEP